ncbi:MAG: winged helix-turn-helix domain-containing protein [Vicinamibacteria bacterium]
MDGRGFGEGLAGRMSYRFDDVEIDPEAFRVTKAGEPVRLEPKAVELLLFLAAQPGRLVSKAEIQAAVWKDTAVTENALTRLVAQIRRGLGDDAREARYIETVPTRGYRFVAPPGGDSEAPARRDPAPGPPLDGSAPRIEPVAARPWAPGLRLAAVVCASLAVGLLALGVKRFTTRPPVAIVAPASPGVLGDQQVSTSASLNVSPCFSPDGASIAYASQRGGSMEIVLRALAPGAREVAITSDRQQNVQPAFSPDGRLLAYHSVGRGGIWIVPALGGVPRQLTRFGSSPAWSPDGKTIAFQGQAWVGSGEGNFAAGEGSTLWTVAAAGGEPRPLTTIAAVGPGGQGAPAWSPDGRLIGFLAGPRVMVVRAAGSGLRRTSTSSQWFTGLAWEKNGRSQIWLGSEGGRWFAWRVSVSPESGEVVGEPQFLAGGSERASAWAHVALSSDGRSVAYVTFRTRYEILSVGLTPDGRPVGEPRPAVTDVGGRKIPLGVSPDGRLFAFGTMRPGVGLALWVADAASGAARVVAEESGASWSRGFFPDSRTLGFVRGGEARPTFWTVDVETGVTRRQAVLARHLHWPASISPDGTRVVAHGAVEGPLNVWEMSLSGGEARRLTDDREGAGWPVWSPDGRQLALELMRGGDTRIGLVPAAGGAIREVLSRPGQSWPQSFSPDGRRIAFAGQREGLWNVYTVAVEGGEERRLTPYATPSLYVRYPYWFPRGDRVLYEYAESASTVWVAALPPAR